MKVEVIIPVDRETRSLVGDTHRARAYNYVVRHLSPLDMTLTAGVVSGEWCKATAISNGLELQREHGDVLVIHDADVIVQLRAIEVAVAAVREERADWAIPHRLVHRLDETTTDVVLKTGLIPKTTRQLVRWPYVGMTGGGIVVLRRGVYESCPLDRRFIGWGSEDQSWGYALETLHGAPWRGEADLYHLWHPHAEPGAQRSPRFESERLRRAYRAYRDRPDAMRALVDGAREVASPSAE